MDDLPYFISVEEARTICFQTPPTLDTERIPIDECVNRVLAETLPARSTTHRSTIRPWTALPVDLTARRRTRSR